MLSKISQRITLQQQMLACSRLGNAGIMTGLQQDKYLQLTNLNMRFFNTNPNFSIQNQGGY